MLIDWESRSMMLVKDRGAGSATVAETAAQGWKVGQRMAVNDLALCLKAVVGAIKLRGQGLL